MTASARSPLPLATVILIVANVAVAFAAVFQPSILMTYGHRPDAIWIPAIFANLFVHANTLHLLGNMVFLAAVGASVELGAGRLRYLFVYFASGLVGVLVYHLMAIREADPLPLVGASGCIAGCAAYYSVRYLRMRVPFAPNRSAPLALITAIWAVLQVAGAFVHLGGETAGVAYFAHLGGLTTGLVLAFALRAPDLAEVRFGHEVLDRMNERGPAAALEAAEQHLKRHPGDAKALRQLSEAHAMLGHQTEEAEALLRLVDVVPEAEHGALYRRVCDLEKLDLIPADRRLRIAEGLIGNDLIAARALLDSLIARPPADPVWASAVVALAGVERDSAPERADQLLHQLVTHDPMHPLVEVVRKRGWLV